jgi:hypothetical protein
MANAKISALTSATTPLAGTETVPIVQSGATVKATVANLTGAGNYAGSFTSLAYTTTLTGGTGIVNLGSNQFYKSAAGFIGIGLVPSFPLDVQSTGVGSNIASRIYRSDGTIALLRIGNSTSGSGATAPAFGSDTTSAVIYTNNTAKMTIASGGDATLSTGNLVIGTSGKGIDFSADPSAAGMTSELLDDYEEGTWTPEVVGTTTAGTATYVYQDGYYTKIGNTVSVTCQIAYSGHTGTGNLRINGLPFNSFNSTASAPVANGAITCDNLTFSNQLEVIVARNSTQITLTTISSGAVRASLPMDAAANLFVSIVYRV